MRLHAKRLALALTAGGLTAGGLTFWHGATGAARAEPMGTVLIVKERVRAAQTIEAACLVVEPRPARYIPPNAITSVGAAVGLRARWDLVPGDVLLGEKLASKEEALASPLRIPEGKRAVALAVDEVVGVAGFVQPGSIVDAIAVMTVDNEPVSKLVLQNVPVLAVAQEDEAPDRKNPQARVSSSVTLAVTPAEAEKLVLATERGKIRLAMRSPDETAIVRTAGSSPESLQGLAKKPAPARRPKAAPVPPRRERPAPPAPPVAKPRPASDRVDVIKGSRLERVDF